MTFTILKTAKRLAVTAALSVSVLLVGCGAGDDEVLKVGVIAGPEADVMRVAVELAEKQHGIDVELVEFSDYISPNVALADGSIDVNAFQHRPYLDSMVRDRGFKLVAVGNTFVYPIAAYSKKLTDISELQDGAKIAIPNDPSNEGRALILLDQRGFIKLKDINNLEATPVDIVENPRKFEFIELDAAQLPRSLDDVDLAFINNTYAIPAGLTPTEHGLLVEDEDSPYVNIIVARDDNDDDPRVAALVSSYQSDVVEAKADELFKGSSVAGWN
ncbi:MetQ/NlpA family ABC transporter substrate-binding protein [Endozoicomonas ascidiicola]|uniref:MetQ/NlpA family ABC transporter substrate-binding protein n=1 Tax=Endozoicomonas ascidiicola TaxID=1698521 RepID=UPI000830E416|nr:MetQ/NlpA family ABC transporter substrate-binding protein [Endozoicomonas ascidiicola]